MLQAYGSSWQDRQELNEWLIKELDDIIMNHEWLYKLYVKNQIKEAIEGAVGVLDELKSSDQDDVPEHIKEELLEILQEQLDEEREEVE